MQLAADPDYFDVCRICFVRRVCHRAVQISHTEHLIFRFLLEIVCYIEYNAVFPTKGIGRIISYISTNVRSAFFGECSGTRIAQKNLVGLALRAAGVGGVHRQQDTTVDLGSGDNDSRAIVERE